MAEEFIGSLCKVKRGELNTDSQRCCICLDDFGTTPSERGVIERALRLPCGHIVGSECIDRWLNPRKEAHNSCPVCRHVFFPSLPEPNPEEHPTDSRAEDAMTSDSESIVIPRSVGSWLPELEHSPQREIGEEEADDMEISERAAQLQMARIMEELFAYRLLVDRDACIYFEDGLIPIFSAAQENALFEALEQRSAFAHVRHVRSREQMESLTNRQIWESLRAEGLYYRPDFSVRETQFGGGWFTAIGSPVHHAP